MIVKNATKNATSRQSPGVDGFWFPSGFRLRWTPDVVSQFALWNAVL